MRAVVLFGHGSRDPLWRRPIEAVAERVAASGVAVRCAYLELDTPTLPTVADELVREGATTVQVVPMFLGAGRHAREDLPRLVDGLRASYPSVAFVLKAAVGEDERVLELLAKIAKE